MSPKVLGVDVPDRYELLEKRVAELEKQVAGARERLDTIDDFEEDSKVTIPSDAPKLGKVGLGALAGVPPKHRGAVLIAFIIVGALVIVALALKGMKVI